MHEKQLPYTVTASLRILTVFPFHSPAGKHLYATNTLQYFVSRCPHCSNDCRACQPGESALEVLPYHCLSDHRTGCGTARCTPSKRESIQNDRKVVSPLVAARLLLLCSPYHMNSDRPIRRACLYGDNVFEKHGINRDRTGDGEKPRCLCGKRGIFNRDGAANYQTT